MSNRISGTTSKTQKRRRNKAVKRVRKLEEAEEAIEQSVAAKAGSSNQRLPGSSRASKRNRRMRQRVTKAEQGLSNVPRGRGTIDFVAAPSSTGRSRGIPMQIKQSLFDKLTAHLENRDKAMIVQYINTLVDPATVSSGPRRQMRIPDADSLQSAIVSSKKFVPVKVVWDPGDPNQGKFSFAARPVLGSFNNFRNYQDYYLGAKGWPDNINTFFTSPELYSNELDSGTNANWPLNYDPNYNYLANSPAQQFTIMVASSAVYAPYNMYLLSTEYPLGSPPDDPATHQGYGVVQTTPETLVTLSSLPGPGGSNTLTLPPGKWYIYGLSTMSAINPGDTMTNIINPLNQSCSITALDLRFKNGTDWTTHGAGYSEFDIAVNPLFQNTLPSIYYSFYVQSLTSEPSQFTFAFSDNNGPYPIISSFLRGVSLIPELKKSFKPPLSNVPIEYYNNIPGPDDLPIGILSQFDSVESTGLADRIRPVAMSVHYKNTTNVLNVGGTVTVSVTPRGLFEKNYLGTAPSRNPGQLQEYSSEAQIELNTASYNNKEGCYAWWRPSDLNDLTYRKIVDTQAQLDSISQQYSAIVVSGVLPPAVGTTVANRQIIEIGYITVTRVYEIMTGSQLLEKESYQGCQDCFDIAMKLVSTLPMVHENPLHWADIKSWASRIGLGIKNAYTTANRYTQKYLGESPVELAAQGIGMLAL